MKPSYDVVVVGSGFGGAITACRLAQSGRSVCVLEQGRRWSRGDFPRTPAQVKRMFWNPTDLGLIDYRAFRNVDVIQGCGVGGGSLVYFNVNRSAPRSVFDRPGWPKGVNRDTLDPYYDRVRDMLEAKPLSPPVGHSLPSRTEAFFEAVSKTGRTPMLVDIAVYTGTGRNNPHSGVAQEGCVYCGNCMLGCHLHAKNTLDLTYIPVAERHGAEVFTLHRVDRVEPVGAEGYRLDFSVLGKQPAKGSVIGRTVVLAAGTLGTQELLFRARDLDRTLPRLGAALGTGLSINGEMLMSGTTKTAREVDPVRGPGITSGADCSKDGHDVFISDLGYPDALMWFLEGSVPTPRRLARTLSSAWTYVARTFGLAEPWAHTTGIEKMFGSAWSPNFLPYLGMGADAANGTARLVNGRLDIHWPHRESEDMYRVMEGAMSEFSKALGGGYARSLLWRWPLRKRLTAHLLGGCSLSDDPVRGVTNAWGQVWNYPGLYVADGSIVPTAVGVGPSATIGALAERVAAGIIKS